MANTKPWYQNGWISVGPFLGNEEQRGQFEKDNAARKAQQGPSMQDYQSYRDSIPAPPPPVPETGPAWAQSPTYAREPDMPGRIAQAAQAQSTPAQFPDSYNNWTWWDVARNPFAAGGEDAYRKARANDAAGMNENAAEPQVVAPDDPNQYFFPEGAGMQEDAPPATTVGPEVPVETQPTTTIDEIRRQKELIDQIYPPAPPQDLGQSELDAETDKDKQRAKYMAQLALFSGITQSAGGQWEGVGKGLAGAGQAYSDGFGRYQKALTAKVNRQQDTANAKYKEETARADAAVKLYGDNKDREAKGLTETRKAIKDRQDDIDTYFKERLGLQKGTDFSPSDPEKINQTLKEWRLSRDRGEIVSNTDVSDK